MTRSEALGYAERGHWARLEEGCEVVFTWTGVIRFLATNTPFLPLFCIQFSGAFEEPVLVSYYPTIGCDQRRKLP